MSKFNLDKARPPELYLIGPSYLAFYKTDLSNEFLVPIFIYFIPAVSITFSEEMNYLLAEYLSANSPNPFLSSGNMMRAGHITLHMQGDLPCRRGTLKLGNWNLM